MKYDIRDDFGSTAAINVSKNLTDEQKRECERKALELLEKYKKDKNLGAA